MSDGVSIEEGLETRLEKLKLAKTGLFMYQEGINQFPIVAKLEGISFERRKNEFGIPEIYITWQNLSSQSKMPELLEQLHKYDKRVAGQKDYPISRFAFIRILE